VLFDLLNWYGLLIGLLGLVVLVAHGANFLAARASTPLARRAQRVARGFWWGKLLLVAALAYPTYSVRHEMFTNFGDHPVRNDDLQRRIQQPRPHRGTQMVVAWNRARDRLLHHRLSFPVPESQSPGQRATERASCE
jgi:hypothetical protein